MNFTLLTLALILGLATALPTNNLKALGTRKNGRLGIYHGTNTTIAKHNYLVGITASKLYFCAGAIVSESYVLTNAFCVEEFKAFEVTVVAGGNDSSTGTSFRVKKIIMNPDHGGNQSYNFALLKIKGIFTFGDDIGAVTLPSADPKSGDALVAVGYYGDTGSVGSSGEGTLVQGTMKYMAASDCQPYYTDYNVTFDATMACAYNKGKVTMCDDDFGNPFTKGTVLYGMMAGGISPGFCTSSAESVIITNVYSVVDWINKYI